MEIQTKEAGSSLLCSGFSLVAESGGYSFLRCLGFSLQGLLLLQSTGSRVCRLPVAAARGLSGRGSQALEHWLSRCGTWS